MKKLSFIILMAMAFLFSGTAIAANLYVDDNDATCGGNSPCYAHPQDAVNEANPGDTILVYPGTYGTREAPHTPPHWGPGDWFAPALIVYKDNLIIRAVDPNPLNTIIESTHQNWSNPVAIQWSTGGTFHAGPHGWDAYYTTPPGITPAAGTAPNGVAIIANGVTIKGFTLRSEYAGDIYKTSTDYPNTAGIMIGGLYAGDPTHLGVTGTTVKNCVIYGHSGIYNWRASNTIIEGNTVTIMASSLTTNPYTVDGNGVVVWDGWFEGFFPPTSTGVQILNNNISTCNVNTASGGEGKGIMFGGTDSKNTTQWNPPSNPLDANGADQSGMLIKGNTICAASSGIKFWNSLGTNKLIACDNIITYVTYRVHDYGFDEGYPPSTWTSGDFCQNGTGTPGYWKNHPEAWPFDSVTIGGVTYAKEEAIELILHSTKNDVTYIMFQALVAAKLNVQVGNDGSCIATTIADADAWMAAHPVGSGVKAGGKNSPWRTGEPLYLQLDAYNNGLLCAPPRY